MNAFTNPSNGHTERVGPAWLWVLLFGVFYFAYKGLWRHAILLFVLVVPTFGIAWAYYVFTAGSHVRNDYLRRGWVPS